jgi:hypothetical protein
MMTTPTDEMLARAYDVRFGLLGGSSRVLANYERVTAARQWLDALTEVGLVPQAVVPELACEDIEYAFHCNVKVMTENLNKTLAIKYPAGIAAPAPAPAEMWSDWAFAKKRSDVPGPAQKVDLPDGSYAYRTKIVPEMRTLYGEFFHDRWAWTSGECDGDTHTLTGPHLPDGTPLSGTWIVEEL